MKTTYIILLLAIGVLFSACKKFLDERPDKSLVVPSSLKDLQAMLDNTNLLNVNYSYAAEIGSDDYYLTTADWQARTPSERNAHIWSAQSFDDNVTPWAFPYTVVYNSNIVLHELEKIDPATDETTWYGIKGQALFFRSFAFFNLLQVFAKPNSADSAHLQPGIPLRLDYDFNKPTTRATVKESYDQLISDTKAIIPVLPVQQSYKTRPSKTAAYALLARAYLAMGEYDLALKYADSVLQLNNSLLDFNTLNTSATNPVPLFNTECIFHAIYTVTNSINLLSKCDTLLYKSYQPNDLRRLAFFKANTDGSYTFKGSYDGTVRFFNGLATDEMYFIRAECYARANNVLAAMDDLNILLKKRWKTNTFVNYTATSVQEALTKILQERRKELVMRGLRWSDLRRLNKEPQFAITIKRRLNNTDYTLTPNGQRYVYPIPSQVIQMTGIQQND